MAHACTDFTAQAGFRNAERNAKIGPSASLAIFNREQFS